MERGGIDLSMLVALPPTPIVVQVVIAAPFTSLDILNLTNNYRTSLGLKPVALDKRLSNAALMHAQDLSLNQYWAHNNPKTGVPWTSWVKASGYLDKTIKTALGENLALDSSYHTATDTLEAWKRSPGHNYNLTNPGFVDVGIAIVPGMDASKTRVYYVVQIFGTGGLKH